MNTSRRLGLGCSAAVLALLLASCGGHHAGLTTATIPTAVAPTPAPSPESPHVVIFSIDGLRPDAMAAAGCSAIGGLAARGAHTWQAQTIMPSTTLPSHASMLSGFMPSGHGINWDDYQPSRGSIQVPTIFAVARAAGLRTVMVVGKEKFKHLDIPGSVERFVLMGTDDEVANAAIAQSQFGFDLMFVHLPQTDLTGHVSGWMSPAYMDAVANADSAVARVLAVLPANTTVILTADHGGHAYTHGNGSGTDMNIPWVVVGPGIAPGRTIAARVNTVDTAATAAQVLGLRLSASATGRSVVEAFDGPTQAASLFKRY